MDYVFFNLIFCNELSYFFFAIISLLQGVDGYHLDVQALFYMALKCSLVLLKQDDDDGKDIVGRLEKCLNALKFHIRSYFWLDLQCLNEI